jgi:50S ribosomal protein L16 3-hydroxylase
MNDPERLGDWFGRFITLYRNAGEVMAPPADENARSRIEVEWDLQHGATLVRHPYSRMAWRKAARGAKLYVNGQGYDLPVRDAKSVANARGIEGAAYATLSQAGRDCVHELLQAGHYRLDIGGEEEE